MICSVFLSASCSVLGSKPAGENLKRILKSSNYSAETEKFVNKRSQILDEMKARHRLFLW